MGIFVCIEIDPLHADQRMELNVILPVATRFIAHYYDSIVNLSNGFVGGSAGQVVGLDIANMSIVPPFPG